MQAPSWSRASVKWFWEAAMQEARAAYAHAYRVKHLGEQADAWHRTKLLTEYVTAVRDQATSLTPGQERTDRGVARLRGCPPPASRQVRRSAKATLPSEAQRRRPQAFPRSLEPVQTSPLMSRKPGITDAPWLKR